MRTSDRKTEEAGEVVPENRETRREKQTAGSDWPQVDLR